MKNILALLLMLLSATTYGQTIINDSTVKVIYLDESHNDKEPAYFINGKFVGNLTFTLDPNMIENFNVVKNDTFLNNRKYYGEVYIKTKSEFKLKLKLISLTSLKDKYTNLGNRPVVFMINGNIINSDYDKYFIDENYLLQIIVDKIKNEKENIDLSLIKLLTKNEEKNIKQSEEIRIRGNEISLHK